MNIKIITCYDVNNFGASLQSYALMCYLQEKGCNVNIIDYKPDYLNYNIWSIGTKWNKNIVRRLLYFLYVVPLRLKSKGRREKFKSFIEKNLSLTHIRYRNNDELKANIPDADIYFAGSDQIWNSDLSNGKDPAFFLDFAPAESIKASYAASFAINQIKNEYKDFTKNLLEKLDYISVREETGIKILESLGIYRGFVVVDPVFLISKEKWNMMIERDITEDYILIYDQENNDVIKNVALKLAKKFNVKIYAIKSLYPRNYANKKFINVGPLEFLSLIKNAKICLTNSFHCIAFSLIFHKEFYLFNRHHENVNSRMIDLLKTLNLEERLVLDSQSFNTKKNIDYYAVDLILENKISLSKNYIQNILLDAEYKTK